jgi:hypothetical protein
MLNHNLVGRGVEHRYLLVKYFPKGIFDYLVYVLQPEAAPCFTNHALNLSRFSCRGRNKWIADVTLKTWCVQSNIKSFGINDIPQIPRLSIRGANDKVVSGSMDDYLIKLSESSGIFLKVSTITMLTNPFGDFSKCLVISSILVDSDLDDVAHEASQLWHTFAHHPRTARCLAFLLVLGRLCSKMSQEYVKAINFVDEFGKPPPDTGDKVPKKKRRKKTSKTDDDALKAFLSAEVQLLPDELHDSGEVAAYWLRGQRRGAHSRIQMALQECVNCVFEAKLELTTQSSETQSHLGPDLERSYQWYLRSFDKDFARLRAVKSRLDGLVEATDRSMDVFSNVTAMIDTKTGLDQNKTIQKLTYLTIGYLPLGLLTAIFAIPREQSVTIESMGLNWFISGLLLMFVATSLAAVYIEGLLGAVSFLYFGMLRPVRFFFHPLVEPLRGYRDKAKERWGRALRGLQTERSLPISEGAH